MNLLALALPIVVFVALVVGAVALHRTVRRNLLGEERDSASETERFMRRLEQGKGQERRPGSGRSDGA